MERKMIKARKLTTDEMIKLFRKDIERIKEEERTSYEKEMKELYRMCKKPLKNKIKEKIIKYFEMISKVEVKMF